MRKTGMAAAAAAALMLLTACNDGGEKPEARIKSVSEKIESSEAIDSSSAPLSPPDALKEENLGIVPVSIVIPAIGVDAPVENVGELDNGQMGVPQNVDGVGWFEPGTKPGDRGSSVLAGHVDSKTGPAVFFDLGKLKKGDEVIVKDKSGTSRTFIVTGKKSFPRKEAPIEDIFGFSYQRNLNLITCTGEFNKKARTHEERLVVYTELKK
ncbi:class F sortase [Fictibacillus iocasae]|uniref:Class F sortase n=1 Tax=Fictibacillus iocasae TaxID=2715437 RepID=A0ABW2NI98_9BACL